jgi:hypothetical protein
MSGWRSLSLSAHWMAEHSIGAHCVGWPRVTDSDPPAVGARLAYSHGVSSAITMVERELTALGHTVTASGAMLETMTHLGGQLSTFDLNAAPINVPSHAGLPHDGREEQSGSAPERPHTSAANWPTVRDVPKRQVHSDQPRPLRPWTKPRSEESLIEPRQVAGRSAAMTTRGVPQLTIPLASLVPSAVAAPATPASVVPLTSVALSNLAFSPSIESSNDASVQSLAPQASAQPVTPASATTNHETGIYQESTRVQRIVMGAVAPGRTPQSTLQTIATQPILPDGVDPNTTEPLNVTPDMNIRPAVPRSRAATAELPGESEPRQGMIILDGAQLGQWVIDHLERYASRPGAITTGIDPRMSAAYPGAPTGL